MDRRLRPRLRVSLDAMWDSSTEAHSARITNLSDGGCYLDSVGEVRQGEIVGFRILLPDGDWLYLEGEVRHHTAGVGFGVQFVDLNDDQQQKLHALLMRARESGPSADEMTADLVEE
jgi:hypothetical protein